MGCCSRRAGGGGACCCRVFGLVRDGVSFATEADPYAIVDWHVLSDANPLAHADEAAEFFGRISADLSANNNVIYEICNEPNNGTPGKT